MPIESPTDRSLTLADRITTDDIVGNLWWGISCDETAGIAQMWQSPDIASPSGSSVDSSSASSSPCFSPDTEFILTHERFLRPVRRSPTLQAHLFHMQRALHTCHPIEIHGLAMKVVQEIKETPFQQKESILDDITERIFCGGYLHIEYSRSFALLAHEICSELRPSSWLQTIRFEEHLSRLVQATFRLHFHTSELEESPDRWSQSITPTAGSKALMLAAFAGDMYAMGILPVDTTHSMIASLCAQLTFLRCRAVYLLLLHAKPHIGPSLGLHFLLKCRRRLVWWGSSEPLLGNEMAQRWILEICNVIDQTIGQDTDNGTGDQHPVVIHRWGRILSKRDRLSMLLGNPHQSPSGYLCK